MTEIRRSFNTHTGTETIQILTQSRSQQAAQIPSKGKRLSKGIDSFLKVVFHFPSLKWLTPYFEDSAAKKNFLGQIWKNFPSDMKTTEMYSILNSFNAKELEHFSTCTSDIVTLFKTIFSLETIPPSICYRKLNESLQILRKKPERNF